MTGKASVSPERRGASGGWGNWLTRKLAGAHRMRSFLPTRLKQLGSRWLPESYYREMWSAAEAPHQVEEYSTYHPKVDVNFGVLKAYATKHYHIVGACRDLGAPYRLIDLTGPDWIDRLRECQCDAYLVWPSCRHTVWRQIYDERLKIIVDEFGRRIYPTYDELWLYESKRRMHYWMEAHNLPHAKTWVFYSYDQAMEFARTAALPIVAKTDIGAGSSGVRVHRTRSSLLRDVRRVFNRGVVVRAGDLRDRQWGYILLQEYIPNAREWRMIRIGDSYFGFEKLRKGEFHSGTRQRRYALPPSELLDFVRGLTDRAQFTSMDLDILVSEDGTYYVSELQAVFGMSRPECCVVDNKPGRMLYDATSHTWRFEAGSFGQNHLWNLRLEYLISQLQQQRSPGLTK